jgi:hypothetical protein
VTTPQEDCSGCEATRGLLLFEISSAWARPTCDAGGNDELARSSKLSRPCERRHLGRAHNRHCRTWGRRVSVAQQLAHVGIGRFVVIDDDVITTTNLNRLVGGTHKDVIDRTPKVDIADRVIRNVNPAATVIKSRSLWQAASELLKECDVIVGGLDNARAKDELDAFARRFFIPYVDMGMDVTLLGDGTYLVAGQVVLTSPGQPCLRCLGIVTESALTEEAAQYGDAGGKPQVVWPNGALASTAVGLVVQLVTPWHSKRVTSAFLEYDGNLQTIRPADALARRDGRQCPHYSPHDVGDPLFDMRTIIEHKGSTNDDTSPNAPSQWADWLSRVVAWFKR